MSNDFNTFRFVIHLSIELTFDHVFQEQSINLEIESEILYQAIISFTLTMQPLLKQSVEFPPKRISSAIYP